MTGLADDDDQRGSDSARPKNPADDDTVEIRFDDSLAGLDGLADLDDLDDGPEFRPVPHPDDRLWRHPAEVAAMQASAVAKTAELPKVAPAERGARSMRVLAAAAAVIAVGATALTLGVLSVRTTDAPSQVAAGSAAATTPDHLGDRAGFTTQLEPGFDTVSLQNSSSGADRTHEAYSALAPSLPRVEAATAVGMREGSGVFVTADGHVVTSAGLVDGADYLLVWTSDGGRWPAKIVSVDADTGLALVKIEATDTRPLALSGAAPSIGQTMLAIDHENRAMDLAQIDGWTSLASADTDRLTDDSSLRLVISAVAAPGSALVDDRGTLIALVNGLGPSGALAAPGWMVQDTIEDLLVE